MSADKGFAARVVEVALHEEVEQMGSVIANGAEFGVATLEDLVAEGGTHVGAAFEKRAGKLRREGKGRVIGPRTAGEHGRALSRSLPRTL